VAEREREREVMTRFLRGEALGAWQQQRHHRVQGPGTMTRMLHPGMAGGANPNAAAMATLMQEMEIQLLAAQAQRYGGERRHGHRERFEREREAALAAERESQTAAYLSTLPSFVFDASSGPRENTDSMTSVPLLAEEECIACVAVGRNVLLSGCGQDVLSLSSSLALCGGMCSLPHHSCAICLDDYTTGQELRTLPCFHFYHKDCFDVWARRDRSCPLCKLEG